MWLTFIYECYDEFSFICFHILKYNLALWRRPKFNLGAHHSVAAHGSGNTGMKFFKLFKLFIFEQLVSSVLFLSQRLGRCVIRSSLSVYRPG